MEEYTFNSLTEAENALNSRLAGCPCCQQIDYLICHLGSMTNPTFENTTASTEVMDISIMMKLVKILETYPIHKALLIGENVIFNSFLHSLLDMLSKRNIDISIYTELPILKAAGFTDIPAMLASYKVHILAHLPTLDEFDTNGWGGYEAMKRSIAALQHLNSLGYGLEQDLPLSVVYYLPQTGHIPENCTKEHIASWLEERLATTVNEVKIMRPRPGLGMGPDPDETTYLKELSSCFNNFDESRLNRLQCQHSICVTWNGVFYDCQTNAILERPLNDTTHQHILAYDEALGKRSLNLSAHCLTCLSREGSALTDDDHN